MNETAEKTFKKQPITVVSNLRQGAMSASNGIQIPNGEYRFDENVGKIYNTSVVVSGTAYNIFPWGSNNRLPNEMVELLKSNGDIGNLLDARIDFLHGTGVSLFKRTQNKQETILTPVQTSIIDEYFLEHEINKYIDKAATHLVETGAAFVNIFKPVNAKTSKLIPIDSLNVRVDRLKKGEYEKKRFLVSGDWTQPRKNAALINAYNYAGPNAANTMVQLMHEQTGQFYYGYPRWWAAADWIRLANDIAMFHRRSLESDNNVAYVCTVAEQYFTDMFSRNNIFEDKDQDAFRDQFHEQMRETICTNDGTNKVIFDEGFLADSGELKGYIRFDAIPRSFKGDEFARIHQLCIQSIANAAGFLPSLAGVADGKVVGGSGSELRVAAEYQQFYRTPRERSMLLNVLNRILLPEVKSNVLNDKNGDYIFGFQNILLQTLDKSSAGSQNVNSAGNKQAVTKNKTANA